MKILGTILLLALSLGASAALAKHHEGMMGKHHDGMMHRQADEPKSGDDEHKH